MASVGLCSLALLVPSAPASAAPTAQPVPSIPRVGAVFVPYLPVLTEVFGLPHTCSASVVHSSGHNVVLTAAHCIVGSGIGYAFAPGYHDGVFPYGAWTVRRVYVNPAWKANHDPHVDYAFLVVGPHTIGGVAKNIEDVVGAYPLGAAPPPGSTVTVDGYVTGSHDRPLTCTSTTYRTSGYPSFDCRGFADGTSGGPWLRAGSVVGVIGGLNQGGCTPNTSYSSPFGAATAAVLARAAAGGVGDLVTPAGSSGCS